MIYPITWLGFFKVVALLTAVLLLSATEAAAGTRRHDVDDSEHLALAAMAEFASVGRVDRAGIVGDATASGSGVLINDLWVLTAAHVVSNEHTLLNPNIIFQLNGTSYGVAEWIIHPLYDGDIANNGYDIGLMRLATPVMDVTPAVRYTGSSEIGNVATIVGFGNTGTGSTGQQLGTHGTKRAGPNVLDALGGVVGHSDNYLLYDFDNPDSTSDSWFGTSTPLPLEYFAAQGDSGGGLFINDGGVQKLAGIPSYASLEAPNGDARPISAYGTRSGSVRVSIFNDWIDYRIDDQYSAQVHTWNQAAGGAFASGANWVEGSAPGSSDLAVFNILGTYTVNLASDVSGRQLMVRKGNVTLNLGGQTYTLSNPPSEPSIIVSHNDTRPPGSTGATPQLTLTNGIVNAVDVAVIAPAALTVGPGGSLHAAGRLLISTGGTFTVNGNPSSAGSFELTWGGTISGTGNLTAANGTSLWSGGTMSGTGTTTIANGAVVNIRGDATKTLSGRTLANAGTIDWTDTGVITGTGSAVINNQAGAMFDAQSDASFTNSGVFNNAGTFRKSGGTGMTNVSWAFHNTGAVQVQTGTLSLASSSGGTHTGSFDISSGATLNFGGGTHNLNAGSNLTGAGTVAVSGFTTVNVAGAMLNTSGPVALGGGTLRITGDNSFNGFNWSAGVLTGVGTSTVANGAVANISGNSTKTLISRTLANAGTINWADDGTINSVSAAIVDNQFGALFDAQGDAILSIAPATFSNAGTFRKSGGVGMTTIIGRFDNTGIVQAQVGTINFSGGGGTHTGLFVASAEAILNFSGGAHALNAGSDITGSGTLAVSGATVNVASSMLNTGAVALSLGTLAITGDYVLNNSFVWTGGTISGSGDTTVANGTMFTITGSNFKSLNGRTLTNSGTINWADAGSLSGFNSTINNQVGGVFDAQGNAALNIPFNNAGMFKKSGGTGTTRVFGAFDNAGTVRIEQGTLQLDGSFTQSASSGRIVLSGGNLNSPNMLTIAAGSLEGTGSITANAQINGIMAPGPSAGKLTFLGNLTLLNGSETAIELGGLTAGTQYDQIMVDGSAVLDGLLHVSLIDVGMGLFTPTSGDIFEILTATNGITGTFASIQLPTLGGALAWDTSQLYTTGILSVVAAGLTGDYNFNGIVDAADYVVWRKGLGTSYVQTHYDEWRGNFGAMAGSGSGATAGLPGSADAAVPEPATWAMTLGALSLLAMLAVRRRRTCGAVSIYRLRPYRLRPVALFATSALFCHIFAGNACAQDSFWIGGTSHWHFGSNWLFGIVPDSSRNALINNGGTAQISGSSPARAKSLALGSNSGQFGTVDVAGAGNLTASSDVVVGHAGTGALNIRDGGAVSNTFAVIDRNAGSNGLVEVAEPGSAWTNSLELQIGRAGITSVAEFARN